jgi:hypothetical protein
MGRYRTENLKDGRHEEISGTGLGGMGDKRAIIICDT